MSSRLVNSGSVNRETLLEMRRVFAGQVARRRAEIAERDAAVAEIDRRIACPDARPVVSRLLSSGGKVNADTMRDWRRTHAGRAAFLCGEIPDFADAIAEVDRRLSQFETPKDAAVARDAKRTKIAALRDRAGTEGERQAAEAALHRISDAHVQPRGAA